MRRPAPHLRTADAQKAGRRARLNGWMDPAYVSSGRAECLPWCAVLCCPFGSEADGRRGRSASCCAVRRRLGTLTLTLTHSGTHTDADTHSPSPHRTARNSGPGVTATRRRGACRRHEWYLVPSIYCRGVIEIGASARTGRALIGWGVGVRSGVESRGEGLAGWFCV